MRNAEARPVIGARQLLAIARAVMRDEPITDVADLSEAIKCRIARLGFAYPQPHEITDAITLVAKSLPVPTPPQPEPSPPDERGRELSHDEACAALRQVFARLKLPPRMKPRTMPPGESELMNTRERYRTVALVEQLRELRRQQRERASTPSEIPDADKTKDRS